MIGGPTLVALAVAAAGVLYLVACHLWPYARCLRCRRTPGKRRAWWGSSWGDCRWCAGRGKRIRAGRKMLDAWRDRGE